MEEKYFPMSSAQRMMYLSQKFSLKKSCVNICVLLTLNRELDEKLLLQALYMALIRCDSSRVHLHKQEDGTVVQYISEDGPDAIVKKDYTGREEEDFQADVNRWSRTPFPNHSMDCQLCRIYLILRPDGRQAVYFCVSHLAFDAAALMVLASDMFRIYRALRDGSPVPACRGDYRKLCENDQTYLNSDKYTRDLEFWREEFQSEPLAALVDPSRMKRTRGKRSARSTNLLRSGTHAFDYAIDAGLVGRVNEMAAGLRISPQVFYMLALRSYLSRVNQDQEDITIFSPVARRATLLEKNSGGTRVLSPLFRMNMKQSLTVTEALTELSVHQKRLYPHVNMPFNDIAMKVIRKLYDCKIWESYSSMAMTYNPFGIQADEEFDFEIQTYSNGASGVPVYLTIMAVDRSGKLNCHYECMDAFADEKIAEAMHGQIVKALDRMTQDPDCTLQDLNAL